jgi:hypothetical protein
MRRQEIIAAGETEARQFLNFITPIYREHPKRLRQPEQFATAIYLSVETNYFLGTAAHVLDETADSTIYCAADTTLEAIEGQSVRSALVQGSRKNDKVDIGIVKLDEKIANRIGLHHFLPIHSLNIDDHGDGEFCVAVGYAVTRNTRVDLQRRSIRRCPSSFTNRLQPLRVVENIGLDPACHLLLEFEKKKAFTSENRKIVAPNPTGMSGGPLLRLDLGNKSGQASLAGVLIEWERATSVKGMLAVRIAVAAAAIRFMCPELASVIPQAANLQITIVRG